jgi:Flp pilus assembly pilin Flp
VATLAHIRQERPSQAAENTKKSFFHLIQQCVPNCNNSIRAQRSGGKKMSEMLRKMWLDDGGQDVPEYALMLALILALVIAVVGGIGSSANSIFTRVSTAMASAATAAS